MERLCEIVYVSAETRPFSDADLRELLEVARVNNGKTGVSGLLLYQAGSFFQVLEGPEAGVASIFERVERDKRHTRVLILRRREIDEASFSEWRMGFACVARGQLEGFSDFMSSGRFDDSVKNAAEVESVLRAFRAGRWRQQIV